MPRLRSSEKRTGRLAWLVVEGQSQGFHCTLNSLDGNGASLTVAGLMGIPDSFSLFVEPESIRYVCAVSERRGNFVKVTFTGQEDNIRFRDFAARR